MMELCERRVVGFSTGSILAPKGWTLDVASQYVVHSSLMPARGSCSVDSPNISQEECCLPRGSSSNTARFECLRGALEGSTLFVTELFVPLENATRGAAATSPTSTWTAERVRRCLERALSNGSVVSDAPLKSFYGRTDGVVAWVREVTLATAKESATNNSCSAELISFDGDETPSTSICAAVTPLFHLFIEIVWMPASDIALDTEEVPMEETAQRMLDDLVRQYNTPALRLSAYQCFTRHTAADADPLAVHAAPARIPPCADVNTATAAAAMLPPPLREPCAPFTVAKPCSSRLNALWGTCFYSAAGGAFVQFLMPESHFAGGNGAQRQGTQAVWRLHLAATHVDATVDTSERATAQAATDEMEASLLRQLLLDTLHLQWEELVASMTTSSSFKRDGLQLSSGGGEEITVAAAALPLDTLSSQTSLYSYVSVELAFEAHMAELLNAARDTTKDAAKKSGSSHCGLRLESWTLQKVSTASSPSLDALSAALERVEMEQLQMDNPALTAAERAMHYVAHSAGPPVVPSRSSTYLLRITHKLPCSPQNTLSGEGEVVDAATDRQFILRLHAPRVQSRHAVVMCMPVPWSWEGRNNSKESDGAADSSSAAEVDWASVFDGLYEIAPFAPSLWLPRELPRPVRSGVCGRSGRLVLHIPSGDARYARLHLTPIACKSFTSLGSIVAWVDEHQGVCGGTLPSDKSPVFSPVAAVWTLIGDGRSAAAYLEDALAEFMYDTGSKNLNNISQPSQHGRQPGVLVVRKRQRQKVKTATTPLAGMQEVCSAWVDVGTTRRLFLRMQDVGVGEVLVMECSLVGPHVEGAAAGSTSRLGAATAATAEGASRAEEDAVEQWAGGIVASAVPKAGC